MWSCPCACLGVHVNTGYSRNDGFQTSPFCGRGDRNLHCEPCRSDSTECVNGLFGTLSTWVVDISCYMMRAVTVSFLCERFLRCTCSGSRVWRYRPRFTQGRYRPWLLEYWRDRGRAGVLVDPEDSAHLVCPCTDTLVPYWMAEPPGNRADSRVPSKHCSGLYALICTAGGNT